MSLDVLDILLREQQQAHDDDSKCFITDVFAKKSMTTTKKKWKKSTIDDDLSPVSSLNSTDDESATRVLPLPLWDRIRQRAAV